MKSLLALLFLAAAPLALASEALPPEDASDANAVPPSDDDAVPPSPDDATSVDPDAPPAASADDATPSEQADSASSGAEPVAEPAASSGTDAEQTITPQPAAFVAPQAPLTGPAASFHDADHQLQLVLDRIAGRPLTPDPQAPPDEPPLGPVPQLHFLDVQAHLARAHHPRPDVDLFAPIAPPKVVADGFGLLVERRFGP